MKSKLVSVFSLLLCGSFLQVAAQNKVFNFTGKVVDQSGRGISDVVVNDGIHFTKTNGQGVWNLYSDTTVSKFVVISAPAAYELPQKDGLADDFFIPVRQLTKQDNKHDFVLKKRRQVNPDFYFIPVSDPQVRNAAEMKRWRQEAVPDIIQTIDSLKQSREVVGMALGDLVFDNMALYDEYKTSIKNSGAVFFQCIGNHDHDLKYQNLHNMALGTPVYAEMYYNRYFGPTDYSFNVGKVHFVTIKNLNYIGGKVYTESLTGQQLEWLKQDLSYVPKESLVILNMHAAAWNRISNGGNVRNAKELKEVLKDYNVHVFCGHTHFCQNNEVASNLYEHNIGAACGTWWSGWVNQDGSPNGYMVVEVNGNDLKWHYKGTRRDFSYQFRLYKTGEFLTQRPFVIANIWDWDSACKVEWYQDGKLMGDMQQFTDADEQAASEKKDRSRTLLTNHLFRALPADGAKEVKVVFTNRFGEIYTQTVKL